METTDLNLMLIEANEQIKRLSFEETQNIILSTKHVILDVREESEVSFSGMIKNPVNIPRGLIEFKFRPGSKENPINIDEETNILLYCAVGHRSALAAKALEDIGFSNVFNIGGFGEWVSNGGEIDKP